MAAFVKGWEKRERWLDKRSTRDGVIREKKKVNDEAGNGNVWGRTGAAGKGGGIKALSN